MASNSNGDIDHLNSFLRGEISAVETYDQALKKLASNPSVAPTLRECQTSHQNRAQLLRTQIQSLGGRPADGSGMWGSFAKLVEGGAKTFGEKAAIGALEEGEDHGRNDYRRDLDDLSPPVRDFVQTRILPEQEHTHDAVSSLKHQISP
jgi:uncharacterized protein (TIGR02284 family)